MREAKRALVIGATGGVGGEVAAALHVHPQTVRYRVAQLRELFGEALDDPGSRYELLLVLRARRARESG